MKRTGMYVCCGKQGKYGTDIYRSVVTDGKDYFVKWKGNLVKVNDDLESGNYFYRWEVRK